MRKFFLFIILIYVSFSCAEKKYTTASWQNNPVNVDGIMSEWPDPLRFYDMDSKLSYSISNDHQNLYFCCTVSSEYLQRKILNSGIDFGIDTLGKKSFGVKISYTFGKLSARGQTIQPAQNQDSKAMANTGQNWKQNRSENKTRPLTESTDLELNGFKPGIAKNIPLARPNDAGIMAAINFDERGFMNYELLIPFSTFYKPELTQSDSNRIFSYEIKINGETKAGGSASGNYRMSGGGMRGGGMRGGGGMHGGGMRGGRMSGNRFIGENGSNPDRTGNQPGTTKTTVKLKLAYK
jgi:hypothetical protein